MEQDAKEKSYSEKQLVSNLLDVLYRRNRTKENSVVGEKTVIVHLEGKDYVFHDNQVAEQFKKEAMNLINTDHAEIFLEEP